MSDTASTINSVFRSLINTFFQGGQGSGGAIFKRWCRPVSSGSTLSTSTRVRHAIAGFCLVLSFGFAVMPAMAAPDLTAGTASGQPGQTVLIPVQIDTDGSVVALQLDLSFDPLLLSATSAGAGSALTDHVFTWHEVAPGQLRLVFTSASASALQDGELATLSMLIDDTAKPGTIPLELDSIIQANANAALVAPTSQNDGSVEVLPADLMGTPIQVPMMGALGIPLLVIFLLLAVWVIHQRGLFGISFSALLGVVLFSSTIVRAAIPPGDANNDGVVDALDIAVIVEQILERSTAPGDPDCNMDTLVDVRDTICAVNASANQGPDLIPPGNRLIQTDNLFQTPLFATDPDAGDVLTFALDSAPAGMSIDPVSGMLSWIPGVANLGNNAVTASVKDSSGLTDAETFDVEVFQPVVLASTNAPPNLTVPGKQTLVYGNLLSVTTSATDDDGDTLTFALVNAPTGMTINGASGLINWTPAITQVGSHDVAVKVSDPHGGVDFGSFVVMVMNVNGAPVANDDVYEARLGVPLNVAADGVLGNDSDPNGDAITAVLQSDAGKGQLTLNADGSFDYLLEPTNLTRPVELELECEITLAGDGSRYLGNNTLAVGDVDNDGDIEIVGINNIDGSTALTELWILNASDCSEQSYINQEAAGSFGPKSHPGLLDIDGDGDLEIITVRHDGEHLIAVHHDGSLAWPGDGGSETSPLMESLSGTLSYRLAGPTFADLDGDGTSEIIMGFAQGINSSVYAGAVAYNATDGSLLWEYFSDFVAGGGGQVRIPTVVDLDLDGTMEVIIHNDVLSHTGVPEFPSRLPTYEAAGTRGRVVTAVANFDEDAYPEILARDERGHYLFNHDGTVIWEIERRNFANSQLTVADFDGDGAPEYALVNCETTPGSSYCPTYYIEVFDGDGSRLWSHKGDATLELQIGNSTSDNITAFDANRDGSFDLVFQNIDINADQIFIFDGRNGSILESIEVGSYGSSGVQNAFLTIADVDGDGEAEIVTSHTGGLVGDTQVWGGTAANPLPTAPTYRNQWAFQAGYSTDARTMTPVPIPHWLQPGSNGWNLIPRSSGTPVDLELECEITVAGDGSRYQSSSTLAVGDVDNDGDIEIVGVSGVDGSTALAELWILNASDCSEQSHINKEAVGAFAPASHPGLLDIDGDGDLEIITVRHGNPPPVGGFDGKHLIAVHHDGSLAWPGDGGSETSTVLDELLGTLTYWSSGPAFADLNADGTSEIIMGFAWGGNFSVFAGAVVYDATDGSVLWDYLSDFRAGGGNRARIPTVVDLDLDGTMEIIIHNDVLSHTGVPELRLPTAESVGTSTAGKVVTAVANFDGDAYPEILAIDERNHYLFNHDGTVVWEIERRNFSNSQVTVADFDGDGAPEYALVNCEPPPGGFACSTYYIEMFDGDGSRLWSHKGDSALELNILFSDSENITAFDANRDGSFDLVFQNIDSNVDRILIIDGRNGSILESIEVGSYWASGVRNAFLTIADVDGDGEAEIVTSHTSGLAGDTQVWGGTVANPLPSAPPYRNQWAYQDGYSSDAKTMTPNPVPHWLQPGRNGWNLIKPMPNPLIGTTDSFTYIANDGDLDSNEATVTLDILPAGNPPLFLTEPDALHTRGFPYTYAPVVVDPDLGDTVTFQLMAAPVGMTINAATGEINWLPDTNGTYPVTIMALDTIGFATNQTWDLVVGDPVVVPDVVGQTEVTAETSITTANLLVGAKVSMSHPTIPAGSVYNQNPPGDTVAEFGATVKLYLSTGPGPLDTDDDSDEFTENEGDCDDDDDSIFPGASDAEGDGIDQDCDGIDGNLVLDSILVMPEVSDVLTSQTVNLKAYGIFENGTSQNLTAVVTWSNGPSFSSATPGPFTVTATRGAINGSATINVHARVTGDDVPPMAQITAPLSNITITEPVDIVGTASDDNFLKYTMAYAVAGSDTFTVFASGTSAVSNGVLSEFDPTMLINDLYTIRLTVYDLGGNSVTDEITLQVDENFKVGNFTLSFIDLQIPVSGIPITVTRTYDSREKRSGDFGFGWFLDINTIRISTNRVLGTGWQVLKSGLSYGLLPTDAHTVSLTFPDGRVEAFEMNISPSSSPIVPFPVLSQSASFTPHPGTLGELESLEENFISNYDFPQPGPVEFRQDTSGDIYNPQRFRYTGLDGTLIDIHKTNGIERIVDPNGNILIFGPGGITHSAGKSVLFQRDSQGRITEITDPKGNTQIYTYDGNGDLRSHTDADGNESRYTYGLNHYMLEMLTPDGARVIRYDYDAENRLASTTDANGNVIQVAHDIGARQETITDRRGGVTVLVSDERGNVLTRTNALGNTTTYTYDANNNETSVTDPLGNTSTYTYDANNNLLTATDPLGNTTTNTFDPVTNKQLTKTDPLGNTTTFSYDSRGNLIQKIDPMGNTTLFTYDGAGNPLSSEDVLGNISSSSYDASGNVISATDPTGSTSTATHDGNGNLLTLSNTRMTTSGIETLTSTNVYDGSNRIIQTFDPLGNQVVDQYGANGELAARIDKNGNQKNMEYDVLGNLARIIYPDGTETQFTYDENGNRAVTTDREGRTTTRTYDALNRVVSTTYPDGATEITAYDAAGRVTSVTDALGNTRAYGYDAAGRRTSVTDALGHVTSYGYDANGYMVSMTDANGNTTNFEYDVNGNRVKTVFPDGTFMSVGYDALGRKTGVTDQAGITSGYSYDALGRLTAVTDALGQVTSYTYDEVGNRLSQTDANGNTTFFEYDGQGRNTRIIRPLGMELTQSYDANGNVVAKTDFNGDTTLFAYDSNNRVVTKTLPDSSAILYSYTATGQRLSATDHRGLTLYSHDSRNRLVQQIEPDGAELNYTYDLNGNRTSVTVPSGTTTYTYDSLNRPATVTDPDGGVTTYTYDNVGNRASTTYPNGVIASYTYDDLNRLVQLENSQSDATIISSFAYTLDPTGRRLQVVDNTGRTVDYEYDLAYRLVKEDIQDTVLGNEVIDYTHDPVGNRLTKTDSSGTSVYSYDANDRLLSDGTDIFTYDNNGNTLTRTNGLGSTTFAYDSDNHLVNILKPGGSEVQYNYDVAGIRVQSTVDGLETNYLVDRNRPYAQVLEERDDLGSLLVGYQYGDDLISQKRSGVSNFYLYDGHGSTKQLVDAAETVTDAYEYDAFGTELNRTGSTQNNYLYTGEQYDLDAEQYYLRARYYDQERGHFLTTDPYSGVIDTPTSLHRYLYTYGDPVNNLDPSGEATLAETLTISVIMVGFGAYSLYSLNYYLQTSEIKVDTAATLKVVQTESAQIRDDIAAHDFEQDLPKYYPGRFRAGLEAKHLKNSHVNAWDDISGFAGQQTNLSFGLAKTDLKASVSRNGENDYELFVTNNFKAHIDKKAYQVGILVNMFSQATGWGNGYPDTASFSPMPIPVGKKIEIGAGFAPNEYSCQLLTFKGIGKICKK